MPPPLSAFVLYFRMRASSQNNAVLLLRGGTGSTRGGREDTPRLVKYSLVQIAERGGFYRMSSSAPVKAAFQLLVYLTTRPFFLSRTLPTPSGQDGFFILEASIGIMQIQFSQLSKLCRLQCYFNRLVIPLGL
jgi:hypothetical protein